MDMDVVQDAKEQEVSIKLPNYRYALFSLIFLVPGKVQGPSRRLRYGRYRHSRGCEALVLFLVFRFSPCGCCC
jgi:hypothetical protein